MAMTRLQSFYNHAGNRFGVTGKYYGVAGHRGLDYPALAGTGIPAWEGGTVVGLNRSYYLGQTIVIRLADGAYAGYAHVGKPKVKLGQEVKRGQIIGAVASVLDAPGASWSGAHSHTTLGDKANSIFQGYVTDPLPRILANLAAAKGRKYTVVSGDTLSGIGRKYGVSWSRIYAANKRTIGLNPNRIRVGAVLTIP